MAQQGTAAPPTEADSGGKIDGETIKALVRLSPVSFWSVIENFKGLALSGGVLIEGKKINPLQWEALSMPDTEAVVSEYIANFIVI